MWRSTFRRTPASNGLAFFAGPSGAAFEPPPSYLRDPSGKCGAPLGDAPSGAQAWDPIGPRQVAHRQVLPPSGANLGPTVASSGAMEGPSRQVAQWADGSRQVAQTAGHSASSGAMGRRVASSGATEGSSRQVAQIWANGSRQVAQWPTGRVKWRIERLSHDGPRPVGPGQAEAEAPTGSRSSDTVSAGASGDGAGLGASSSTSGAWPSGSSTTAPGNVVMWAATSSRSDQ